MAQTALTFELRNYQQKWIKSIWNSWGLGNRRVLAQLPTGAGKTVCFAHICHKFFQQQQQVLVIAHRIELISQAAEKLEQIIGESVGIIKSGVPAHPERRVQVASVQTLARRKILELPLDIGLLIFDEAHHASASSYRRLIENYENAQILGVTATPQRIDGQGFVDLFDDLVIGVDTAQLIKAGYLSKFRLFTTNQTISTLGVLKSCGDFRAKELAVAVTSQIGVTDILENYLKYAQNLRTVIFASSLEHSRALADEFCRHQISAEHLDGQTPPQQRLEILQRFRTGTTQVITNYEILTEGYDCPNIECIYCVRPTESSTLWLQMTGRVLRTHSLKPTAVIIDVTDNWKKHGLPDEQRQWSLSPTTILESNSKGLIQCEHCTHAFKPLSHELAIIYAEMGEDGKIIQHHQATCPSCATTIDFKTLETISSNQTFTKIRLRHSLTLEITEIDLSVSVYKLEMVDDLLTKQRLKNAHPSKIYTAIFMAFIESITKFTLGDWREIVKMVEPTQPLITKKAWELYTEAFERHKNRLLALSFIEQRKSKGQPSSPAAMKETVPQPQEPRTDSISSQKLAQPQSPNFKKNLGNPYFRQKYASEWKQSLEHCSMLTADFLKINAGLFHVETTPQSVNISIEIRGLDGLKSKINEICDQTEIQQAFSQGFGKQAKVMLRLD
ncbi:Superfamily II DNA or RNA helicase [Nostoc flagelliforme CCNUN1]|uniref:Superfamily II DNA or RNA helicase n=1 Tax=Nostoc flagelliforme CCNUN1 TaxID=2038116 RepID=A0A2K8SJG1_9NOSO|nr:DEAD/DEAH box helicase [Nostoc flagelliforme]AUB35572.1 Superfamily II DNA or RNA helicase [Nostoc flagelliforme CCNUN1]